MKEAKDQGKVSPDERVDSQRVDCTSSASLPLNLSEDRAKTTPPGCVAGTGQAAMSIVDRLLNPVCTFQFSLERPGDHIKTPYRRRRARTCIRGIVGFCEARGMMARQTDTSNGLLQCVARRGGPARESDARGARWAQLSAATRNLYPGWTAI
ncbi:hypothetical protein HYPSUDRAFT_725896 [Hypholoma sublateritium FD-334 SS-4]|uniref:Uncharacterized protein n=1 Tax=Hypholoma sublateritium (strain FD-334 SS-4) TaxID=945553 RepID=A0A0D2MDG0_HYPSF|nr:hypothetical protein HYPSUDRAFT_725896 [Hypholoma sublateritium FD-334 SS-4]